MTATMPEVQVSETDRVLVDMLTENTGRHFLDSGGAYGRNWERNQGREIQSWIDGPDAWFDGYGVTLSLFHWLRSRLSYHAEMDNIFQRWTNIFDPDSPWLASMETFAFETCQADEDDYLAGTYNSYNSEDNLSQVIQFTIFTPRRGKFEGETFVLLQIHGGCDVRGGYTAAKVFTIDTYEVADMLSFTDYEMWCESNDEDHGEPLPGMPERTPHAYSHRGGDLINYEGEYIGSAYGTQVELIGEDEDGQNFLKCPDCGRKMSVSASPV